MFYLHSTQSVLNDISVTTATKVLTDATADLYHVKKSELESLVPMDDPNAFTVILDDMRPDPEAAELKFPGVAAAAPPMAESIQLDAMFVDDDHIKAIREQGNVPPAITAKLLAYY
jgi:hypothetical protein